MFTLFVKEPPKRVWGQTAVVLSREDGHVAGLSFYSGNHHINSRAMTGSGHHRQQQE